MNSGITEIAGLKAVPEVTCPVLSTLQEFIEGLGPAYQQARKEIKAGRKFDYSKPTGAITILAPYTFRLNLLKPLKEGALRRPLLPAAPGQLARRLPMEILMGLSPPAPSAAASAASASAGSEVGLWRTELEKVQMLWFARRRLFADRQNVVLLTEVQS